MNMFNFFLPQTAFLKADNVVPVVTSLMCRIRDAVWKHRLLERPFTSGNSPKKCLQ
ncbi:hypothetical protein BQ8482_270014 [Mesorhizobium delmotii]|uniref:Uncharacterized protein n=1 Tax=Mesorhizobium delmotii TaxID=1631247 RepID=A0A2P9AMA2_9HYPH|nr:hypothetical protein BQ8482_270014 [Mesorhizobium delmotii]